MIRDGRQQSIVMDASDLVSLRCVITAGSMSIASGIGCVECFCLLLVPFFSLCSSGRKWSAYLRASQKVSPQPLECFRLYSEPRDRQAAGSWLFSILKSGVVGFAVRTPPLDPQRTLIQLCKVQQPQELMSKVGERNSLEHCNTTGRAQGRDFT